MTQGAGEGNREAVSGQRYVYDRVTAEAHRAFVDAESKGRHFQSEIRDRYPFRRLS